MDRALDVLLVEDSPSDRRLLADVLSEAQFGIRLIGVATGEEALAFLRHNRPDLILLDLGLPGLSGREVLAALRDDEELRRLPVVVLTGDESDEAVVETLGLGAHEHLSKPLTLEQFLGVVEYVTQFA